MQTKPEMSRLCQFYKTLSAVVEVLKHGEEKHGNDLNWQTYSTKKDIDAALRHVLSYPEIDGDTKQPHIVNALVRLLFACEKTLNENTTTNNRTVPIRDYSSDLHRV